MSEQESAPASSWKSALPLGLVFVVTALLAILGRTSDVPGHNLATVILWILPGLFLTLASGRMRAVSQWLLTSFLVAYVTQFFLLSGAKLIGGFPLDPAIYQWVVVGGTALAYGLLVVRVASGSIQPPWQTREERQTLWLLFVVFAVATFLLQGTLAAQDLNDDGLEALYIGESLNETFLPRWPTNTGLVGLGVGMFAQAFPNHFFVFWHGAGELAPRLPFLLGLPVVLAALFALIEAHTEKRLELGPKLALTGSLVVFALVMLYSAGYDAYWCEPSSPGAYEMLLMAFVLGGLWSGITGRLLLLIAFAVLAHLARPSGILIFGLFFVASFLFGGEQRKAWTLRFFLACVACVIVSLLHEKVYTPYVLGDSNLGYDSRSALARFRFLTISDARRIAWFVVPCGILPFLSLFWFRAQDALSRVLTAASAAYAGAFYIPAFVSLHHYVPLMLFPLVVYWRLARAERLPFARQAVPLALALTALSAFLSRPNKLESTQPLRELGARIVDRRDEPKRIEPNPRRHAEILEPLIQFDDPAIDPDTQWFGSPWSLYHYIQRGEPSDETAFMIQPDSEPITDQWTELSRDGRGAVLVVRSSFAQSWRDEVKPPSTEFAAPLYSIDLDIQFRHRGIPKKRYDIDVREWIPYGN